jgi:hypothetical protein
VIREWSEMGINVIREWRIIGVRDKGRGAASPPPNFGKPRKFGLNSENRLNSGNFITILHKNLGKRSTPVSSPYAYVEDDWRNKCDSWIVCFKRTVLSRIGIAITWRRASNMQLSIGIATSSIIYINPGTSLYFFVMSRFFRDVKEFLQFFMTRESCAHFMDGYRNPYV